MSETEMVNYHRTVHGMHAHVLGRGPALLLCNGIGASTESWGDFAGKLSRTHTVIMFDAPGCGRSNARWAPWTMRSYAADVVALLRALGFRSADVLGLSWGGALAQQIAASHPDAVNRLILAATTPGPTGTLAEPHVLALAMTPLRYFSKPFAAFAAPHLYGGPGGKLHSEAPTMRGYSHQMLAIGSWSGADGIRAETMVIHGDDDRITPVGNAEALARRIPHARLAIQAGQGHLWLITDTDASTSLIDDFLLDSAAEAA